jgi:hypothetical protein
MLDHQADNNVQTYLLEAADAASSTTCAVLLFMA